MNLQADVQWNTPFRFYSYGAIMSYALAHYIPARGHAPGLDTSIMLNRYMLISLLQLFVIVVGGGHGGLQ